MQSRLPYVDWKRNVDTELVQLCGMDSECLPDFDYRADYDARKSPKVTAKRAISAAKSF